MEIFKAFTFEAAHRLPNLPKEHKCFRLHGHTFRCEVHVAGPLDAQRGWIIDFSEISDAMRPILDQLDHTYLNEIEGLANPTSENIARWIWRKASQSLPGLAKVIVQETCNSGCVCEGL